MHHMQVSHIYVKRLIFTDILVSEIYTKTSFKSVTVRGANVIFQKLKLQQIQHFRFSEGTFSDR